MTVAVLFLAPMSAKARMFAISISGRVRPRVHDPSMVVDDVSAVSSSAMAAQSRSAKYLRKRSSLDLPRFPAAVSTG